jgi:hypothetical protein
MSGWFALADYWIGDRGWRGIMLRMIETAQTHLGRFQSGSHSGIKQLRTLF